MVIESRIIYVPIKTFKDVKQFYCSQLTQEYVQYVYIWNCDMFYVFYAVFIIHVLCLSQLGQFSSSNNFIFIIMYSIRTCICVHRVNMCIVLYIAVLNLWLPWIKLMTNTRLIQNRKWCQMRPVMISMVCYSCAYTHWKYMITHLKDCGVNDDIYYSLIWVVKMLHNVSSPLSIVFLKLCAKVIIHFLSAGFLCELVYQIKFTFSFQTIIRCYNSIKLLFCKLHNCTPNGVMWKKVGKIKNSCVLLQKHFKTSSNKMTLYN